VGTNIDGVDVAIVICIHVAIGEETVGEKGEEDEFGKSEELVTREGEADAPG